VSAVVPETVAPLALMAGALAAKWCGRLGLGLLRVAARVIRDNIELRDACVDAQAPVGEALCLDLVAVEQTELAVAHAVRHDPVARHAVYLDAVPVDLGRGGVCATAAERDEQRAGRHYQPARADAAYS
jgi:hypothetical protein